MLNTPTCARHLQLLRVATSKLRIFRGRARTTYSEVQASKGWIESREYVRALPVRVQDEFRRGEI